MRGASVEFHGAERALSVREVRAGQSLDLVVLEGSILVPETLAASAGRGRKVSVCLELPVCPAYEVVVSCVTDLVDLLRAGAFSQAGTELSDNEGHTKALSILCTLANTFLVPL